MKKVISGIVIIMLIATVGYIVFDILSEGTRNVPSTAKLVTPEQEKYVKAQIDKTRQDLKALAIALESYRVDYKCYPKQSDQLTTPISYIVWIPKDEFNPSEQLKYCLKDDKFKIYSIGPDQQDDQLTIIYDPTNGLFSTGDISFL